MDRFRIYSIGKIINDSSGPKIEIKEPYREAMEGLDLFSHIQVFYWFHENDTEEGRSYLKVHPCKNPDNPLIGVFATHSPLRPNLIGLTRCRITRIDRKSGVIFLDDIDAINGSPLIDIKCYFPPDDSQEEIKTPDWRWKKKPAEGNIK